MKLAKRMLAASLLLVIIFAFVACAGDPGTTNTDKPSNDKGSNSVVGTGPSNTDITDTPVVDTTPPPIQEEWEPDQPRPTSDTNGKTYIIIQHTEEENPFGYSQDSVLGLQIADRISDVEELYGCTLDFSQIPYDDAFPSQLQALQYSDNGGDLIFSNNNAMLRRALGTGPDDSLCYDLLKFDHIINFWDFNKWGNITARECMMAGGVFYGVSPALWVDCTPLPYYTVVYNKDMCETSGVTDPQETWEKGEWDTYAMVEAIQGTTNEADGVWGMTAHSVHMVRATFLATGLPFLNVEVAADGEVLWDSNLDAPEVVAAFQWLKNTLTANAKCFNNGKDSYGSNFWEYHIPFNDELCAMVVSRPSNLLGSIVVEGPENFGIISWAGMEANVLSGYYENVYAIAIPNFAQNADHSAYLMFDLFKGLGDIKGYDDVMNYYLDTYFSSDVDITCLVRPGAKLQYSYWPNGCDAVWENLAGGLMTSSSIQGLIDKNLHSSDGPLENHMVPNQVALKAWKDAGKID